MSESVDVRRIKTVPALKGLNLPAAKPMIKFHSIVIQST